MTTSKARAAAGAKGGAVSAANSPAKAAALAALHASRRSVPVHPEPPPELGELARIITRGREVLGQRNPASISEAARQIRVNQRTLRRWLSGEDRPAKSHHRAIVATTRRFREMSPP